MNRRDFTRICSSMLAGVVAGAPLPVSATNRTEYSRTQLLDSRKQPITIDVLDPGEPYVFFYPFVTTPSFLIDLGEPTTPVVADAQNSQWQGGVGPHRSVVAYSAICSHKMSHPAKEISFINYRHDAVTFFSRDGENVERTGVISCCSERSVYDPRDGARVLAGPAPQPLASIELQVDDTSGSLYATASYGGDMYDRFFEKFGFRAAMEHRVTDPRQLTGKSAAIRKVSEYSSQTIKC